MRSEARGKEEEEVRDGREKKGESVRDELERHTPK